MATRDEADRTLAAHADDVLRNRNVSAVSVIEDGAGGSLIEIGLIAPEVSAGAQAVTSAPDELVIPDAAGKLASGGRTIKVRKRVIGRVTAYAYKGRYRPARGGASCGPGRAEWAGTLGARVLRKGKFCILSNWHVLYGGAAKDGDAVIQQGSLDGGSAPEDTVADNLMGVLSDQLDAALAAIRDPVDDYVGPGTMGLGKIAGVKPAMDNALVRKCGRTTGDTSGTVTSTNATVRVGGYPGGDRVFRNQIQTTAMSEGGDSGAIVLEGKNFAIGLLFAGSGSDTFANNMEIVVEQLQITFA